MPNRGLIRVLGLLGAAALAGCQTAGPPAALKATASQPSGGYGEEGAKEPAPQKKKTASLTPVDHPRPSPSGKTDDAESPDIGAVGLEESKVRNLFGVPVSEVDDAPAKRLSYKTGACSIEFTLYPDVDTRTYRTLTLEVRNDDGTPKGQRICVADLKSRIEDRR